MSTRHRRIDGYRLDSKTLGLVALFTIVIGGALWLRPLLVASGVESAVDGSSNTTQAATGAAWALAEAVFAGLLVLGLAAWRYLPEWLQEGIRQAAKYTVGVGLGVYGVVTGSLILVLGAGIVLILTATIADAFDVWWVVNNALALGLAIYLAANVGIVLGPVILGVGLVGLAAYDYLFADWADWMFGLAETAMRRKLPLLVIVPERWQTDWETLIDDAGEEDDFVGWGIGMADLLLPAAFAVSLADAGGLLAVGVAAGTLLACVRVSWKLEQGGGAGLPPLVTGALGGWGVAAVVGVILP